MKMLCGKSRPRQRLGNRMGLQTEDVSESHAFFINNTADYSAFQ